jgi:GAF domain-containing protein
MGLGFLSRLWQPQQPDEQPAQPAAPADSWVVPAAPAPSANPAAAPARSASERRTGAERRKAAPVPADMAQLEVELQESRAAQNRLRQDLAELLKAHRQQSRVLERNQKQSRQQQEDLSATRDRFAALESELAAARKLLGTHTSRVDELEAQLARQATLETAYQTVDKERQDLAVKLAESTRSQAGATAERERLSSQLATLHATLAARDAQVAALEVAEDEWKEKLAKVNQELSGLKSANAQLTADLGRHAELQAAHNRLQLEFEAHSARLDVARAQLLEAEQQLKSSQATIKAAQRLSSSVEWRQALDSVLDAASELVRFERGTLALVDEVQEELKVEAARNSPIAISEMSRFKVGEGIAGWALSHREPVLVRDSRSDARFKASDPSHQPRSFIAVPLLAGKEGLGVLTVARTANDPFTDQDLRSLSRVANDAATALTNARLVAVLKQREDHLSALVQKARELWSADDINQVVQFVLSSSQELVNGKGALLALRNLKTSELEVIGSNGIPQEILQQRIAWGAPAAADVMRTGKPWVSPMRELLPPALVDTVTAAGFRSLVSVSCGAPQTSQPAADEGLLSRSDVESADEVNGVLNVYRDTEEAVSAAQLEQLRAFADQAAVAIKHVRRWDRVKEQLQTSASVNTRLMGRERYIHQLHYRIQQLEQELGRYKAA